MALLWNMSKNMTEEQEGVLRRHRFYREADVSKETMP